MIAFGTVIYKSAMPYFPEFIYSINNQVYKDFVLLIINDDVPQNELQHHLNKIEIIDYVIINYSDSYNPVQLRIKLLEEAKNMGYSLLIMGDCDDKFYFKRVINIIKSYNKNQDMTFYYNDLLLFNNIKAMGNLPDSTYNIGNIIESNYLGLSNTAINLNKISNSFIESLNECDTFVFDWYLFSRILLNGGTGILVSDAFSLYRIHENNYAGLNSNTRDDILKEYNVKIKHYSLLSKYNDIFYVLLKKYKAFDIEMFVSQRKNSGFWWSNIKLL